MWPSDGGQAIPRRPCVIIINFPRRYAIQTLSELDDRALRDIGIEHSRIESAVRGSVDPDFGRIT
ncbi:DUF1127 domain-containing protein [Bradyrhizobium sp. AZCC 1721]|uniref:DUF1127 domain-containing protein n=1 Tax=Bradyrhizobium sp. AZCC 1721 TaxID=3117016 RepID=UPI0030682480